MKKAHVIALYLSACQLAAIGQEEETSVFESKLNAGLALTEGNSKTLQANATFVTEGEREGLGSVRTGLEANYGRSRVDAHKETTVENMRAFANLKKTISAKTFVSINSELFYDSIAQIDYRAILGPGIGCYLVKNVQTSLSIESGPAYLWEKADGITDDYLVLRFAERCVHKIGKTAEIWLELEYLPRADDFSDYLLNAEFGAEAALITRMNLRVVLRNNYNSVPGGDLKKNDLALIAGIGVSL